MASAGLEVLVQGKDELDVQRIIEFIEGCMDPELVLVYSSLRDDFLCLDVFRQLVESVEAPFLGARVVASATRDGYLEDGVVVGVLSGDFNAKAGKISVDYDNLDGTVEGLVKAAGDSKLVLAYSANLLPQDVFTDYIMRHTQSRLPDTQFIGGVTAPEPMIACNEGVFKEGLVYATVSGLEFDFSLDSGFTFKEDDDREYVVTKADEFYIYELDGEDAVEKYSKLQHMQPYMVNMLASTFTKIDMAQLLDKLANTSETLYEGVLKGVAKVLGKRMQKNMVEIVPSLKLSDNKFLSHNYTPEGTRLKWIDNKPENHLAVYDRILEKHPKASAYLISSCFMQLYWSNFRTQEIQDRLSKLKAPYIVNFLCGEIGTTTPYKNPKENVLNGGTTKTLALA